MSETATDWLFGTDAVGQISDISFGFGNELILDFGDPRQPPWVLASQSSPWCVTKDGRTLTEEEIGADLAGKAVASVRVSREDRALEISVRDGVRIEFRGDRVEQGTRGSLWQVFEPRGVVWTALGDGTIRRSMSGDPPVLTDIELEEMLARHSSQRFFRERVDLLAATVAIAAIVAVVTLMIIGQHTIAGFTSIGVAAAELLRTGALVRVDRLRANRAADGPSGQGRRRRIQRD